MENLDQWTSDAFKNVENDLLQKKERRKQIVQEIEQCRNDIVVAENNIKQLEQQGNELKQELQIRNRELEALLKQMPRYDANNPEEYERARRFHDMQVISAENAIKELNEKISRITEQIHTENQKIRELRVKILQLQSEDNEIVNGCKQHMTTQRNVVAAAENAIKEHTLAKKILDAKAKNVQYGKDAIRNAINETEKSLKAYEFKKKHANFLVSLAYAIIYGDYGGGGIQTSGGENDGPNPGSRPSPRIWDQPTDSTSTDNSAEYTYKPSVQDVTPCFQNQREVEEFGKIYGMDWGNDNDINPHKRR